MNEPTRTLNLTEDEILATAKALDKIVSSVPVMFSMIEGEAFLDARRKVRAIAEEIIHESRSSRRRDAAGDAYRPGIVLHGKPLVSDHALAVMRDAMRAAGSDVEIEAPRG